MFRYAHAIQEMIHIVQQRQILPWLQPDWLFRLSGYKKEYDDSLKLMHDFTKTVIAGCYKEPFKKSKWIVLKL